jgi:hypothetical protein
MVKRKGEDPAVREKKSKKRSGLAHNMWYCGSYCGCGLKKIVL